MTGKARCEQLRQVRRKIALDHEFPFPENVCPYEGSDCSGSCEACDAELKELERHLERRTQEGLPVILDMQDTEVFRFRSDLGMEEESVHRPGRNRGNRGMMRRSGRSNQSY